MRPCGQFPYQTHVSLDVLGNVVYTHPVSLSSWVPPPARRLGADTFLTPGLGLEKTVTVVVLCPENKGERLRGVPGTFRPHLP